MIIDKRLGPTVSNTSFKRREGTMSVGEKVDFICDTMSINVERDTGSKQAREAGQGTKTEGS